MAQVKLVITKIMSGLLYDFLITQCSDHIFTKLKYTTFYSTLYELSNEVSLIQIEQLEPLDLKITCKFVRLGKIVWNCLLTEAQTVYSSLSFFFRLWANQQQKLILLPDVTVLINEGHKCAQMEPDNLQEMVYAVGLNYGKTLWEHRLKVTAPSSVFFKLQQSFC